MILPDFRNIFYENQGILYWKIKPCSRIRVGDIAGHKSTKVPYLRVRFLGRGYPVHKIIYFLHYGEWPVENVIDHINRNKLDNRIENLRVLSFRDNIRNSDRCDRELPVGVYQVGQKYVARTRHPPKHLGTFLSIEEAKDAFETAINRK